jgi:hypothetical protein
MNTKSVQWPESPDSGPFQNIRDKGNEELWIGLESQRKALSFPYNQSVNQSISQSVNQSISQSVNQSISQSVNQSISQSVNQSIDQTNEAENFNSWKKKKGSRVAPISFVLKFNIDVNSIQPSSLLAAQDSRLKRSSQCTCQTSKSNRSTARQRRQRAMERPRILATQSKLLTYARLHSMGRQSSKAPDYPSATVNPPR